MAASSFRNASHKTTRKSDLTRDRAGTLGTVPGLGEYWTGNGAILLVNLGYWPSERDHDLREHIPHTWASSHDNLFQSNFSAWSSDEAILGTTPDWPT